MFRKTIRLSFLLVFTCCAATWAGDANDCIREGRQHMFDGTLSGLRLAHQTFDNCLNDPCCPDCSTNRELKFLRAVAGTAMLVIRDDDGSIDSVLELAKLFEIHVLGDYWASYFDPCGLDLSAPSNQYDAYEIPAGAPDANGIRNIIDTSMIPEIDAIIADLNSINDEPNDRFRIFLDPNETRIFFDPNSPGLQNDVEVDYGEVLILKGLLTALKARLQAQSAYDMYTDTNDMIVEKIYDGSFNINADLLDPHPDLLNVLPTPNYPDANGKAILDQARQDWIDSIDYYLYTIDYIRREREEDPNQEDELFYIDPNDDDTVDVINDRLITLRDSLIDDTVATFPWETAKIYTLEDTNSATTWKLELVFDFIGLDAEGSFVLVGGSGVPSPWEITYFTIEDDELIAEMDYDVPGYWGGALFAGMISQDHNTITNGRFEYWGPADGNLTDLSGQLLNTEVEEARLDLNPVFSSSPDVNDPRYVQPVNPRDLLPVFDEWNGAQPGTVGHGLPNPNDATLGGILPDMTQYDWQVEFDLQPGGLFYLDFISPYQLIIDGNVSDWTDDQLVFVDISGDADDDSNTVPGVDIEKLYMAYDSENLYGAITFYDNISNSIEYSYDLYLSYPPGNYSALDAIWLDINVSGGSAAGSLYHKVSSDCYTYWDDVNSFDAAAGLNAVEFKIPFTDIPADLPGRFILLESGGWNQTSHEWAGEWNGTSLRIADVGTISGTVSYNGYKGEPIIVQAYTDPEDPDGIIASALILEPGPYTLQGIGLGWRGYVKAFTPSFGFDNILWSHSFDIEDSIPVYLMGSSIDGIDLVLTNPTLLENGVWVDDGRIVPKKENQYYAFDAVQGGTYNIEVIEDIPYDKRLALLGRDGDEILVLDYDSGDGLAINGWFCPVSGRYYAKLQTRCETSRQVYRIRMTTDTICPQADIANADWVGVKDCKVDFYDLTVLVSHWLDGCSEPYWCDESDFDESRSVDFADFAVLAGEWLQEETP